jgi:hypothetical protein
LETGNRYEGKPTFTGPAHFQYESNDDGKWPPWMPDTLKGVKDMHSLRIFSIIAWIAIPTVMYGGYALLGLLTRGGLSEFQQTFFRAGHAHAGVLLLMSLLYHSYMEQTNLSPTTKLGSAVIVLVGILAQSGGFFLHLALGQPGAPSLGTTITSLGAALLAISILILVYGLITSK